MRKTPIEPATGEQAGIRAAKAGGMFAVAVHSAAGCPLADVSLGTFEELLNIG